MNIKEFHGFFRGIDEARRPSTMAENRRFMNIFKEHILVRYR
jgi:hypothetical protein